ncbi:unnamed protein product [Cylicostephanus goldi]|uniref:Uncharacterized protein n=1 Tax=Cylicostephanus goldi TaxID=71465 RepID=A0A3P7MBJ2_CYLGO|nr:unnamed protein product [Cylicostephanus goldi]
MGAESAKNLHLRDEVDFKKIHIYYMEGIHSAKMETLSSEMREALLEVVSYFEKKFDLEAIRIDLPIATMAIEMIATSIKVEGPTLAQALLSLHGDKGSLNWMTELPKLLIGNSVHTPGAILMTAFESMDNKTEQERTELQIISQAVLKLLFRWPRTAPYHNQPVFAPFDLAYTGLYNALALPAITCPLGLDSEGLPLGVQIIGARNSDRLLIAAAQQLSQAFGGWTPAWSSK